ILNTISQARTAKMGYPPRTCLGHGRVSADAKCSALQVLTATTAQARIGYPMTATGPGATILLPSTTKGLPQPAVPLELFTPAPIPRYAFATKQWRKVCYEKTCVFADDVLCCCSRCPDADGPGYLASRVPALDHRHSTL